MHSVYKNIDNYNLNKENKVLIVSDDMIADVINNKTLNSIVTELFIRGRKLNISLSLLHNHTLKFLRTLEIIVHNFLL